MNQLLDQLNPAQQQVVTTTQGPVLVLAGAGSGKTRCVIYRTAWLINQCQVSPWNILIVTFTNKAARELRDRLTQSFSISPYSIWCGTFHSICMRILRAQSQHLPFTSNFSIYDTDDQKSLLRKLYKRMDIDTKVFVPGRVLNIISRLKNDLIRPDKFFEYNPKNHYTETVHGIYIAYQQALLDNNALDFDDLLLHTAYLLFENNDVRLHYANQFKHIMIDEYQDTNTAQFTIIRLLAREHNNICVVGDDDQAIYSWRGANIRNILEFEHDYPGVKKIKLEQNYRSTQPILELANSLITHNSDRHTKTLWSDSKATQLPRLYVADDETHEAAFVADEIKTRKDNTPLNEIVVLYRTNAQSRVFETTFVKAGLPYRIVGGVNFYQRKEIKDIIAYLRLLVNPNDGESFMRVINFPARGIGAKTLERLVGYALDTGTTLSQALLEADNITTLAKNARTRLQHFGQQLQIWRHQAQEFTVPKLVQQIIADLNLVELWQNSDDPQEVSRAENIKEFMASVLEFAEARKAQGQDDTYLDEFLQNLSLQTDLDEITDTEQCVKLMTIHNAKGLEFDTVFVCGIEDGLLPHQMSIDTETELQEERRLLYVAITRARKTLWLCWAKMRRTWEGNRPAMPSRFLREIPASKLEAEKNDFYRLQAPRSSAKATTPAKPKLFTKGQLHKGQLVEHANFGRGVILNIEGSNNNAKATVSFKNGQLKKILASYLKPLN